MAVENMTPAFYFFEKTYMFYIMAPHALHAKKIYHLFQA
jgi:hypothetical protein